jgi:hypothetical protein
LARLGTGNYPTGRFSDIYAGGVAPMGFHVAGAGQLCVLVASALVPFQLKWKTELAVLSRLHRQMYWVYGGYVVLAMPW